MPVRPTSATRFDPARRLYRLASRFLALALAVSLLVAPPTAIAQYANLPRLGDAAADELSPALERRIGEQIIREMRRERAVADDPEVNEWLNAFAAKLATTEPARGHSLELFLVSEPTLNAFAMPGGFIGVHSGLIVAAQSESELASVIAHEIAHVTQRHIARMLAQQGQASVIMLAAMVLAALAASSNPQAAAGVASLGGTFARQQMLGFSRDAEREADRMGLDMLERAGFDTNGMVGLLNRLQSANRLHETGAPDYLRSHPITSERIADIQNRLRETRYRQRPDSIEFRLIQARLRALTHDDPDGLRQAAARFERQLRDRTIDPASGWFALAAIRHAQRDAAAARKTLEQARSLIGPHPFVERLAGQVELDDGKPDKALALAEAALASNPGSAALIRLKARTLLALDEDRKAADFLSDAIRTRRGDPELFRLQAEAWNRLGDEARAYRAAAEQFALLGGLPAAIEQLRRARQARTLDFYTGSQVDARLRELEAEYLQEQQDRKEMGGR